MYRSYPKVRFQELAAKPQVYLAAGTQFPVDVAFDGARNVYIADSYNHRIQVFTPEGQYLRKFGSEGSGRGQLSTPSSIAIDKDTVYVTDYGNDRVSVFTTTGQFLHSFGTKGKEPGQFRTLQRPHQLLRSFHGHSPSTKTTFESPWGIAIDGNGFILVSDRDNNRVQTF